MPIPLANLDQVPGQGGAGPRWRDSRRALTLAAWLLMAALLVATFAAGVPVRWSQLLAPADGEAPVLVADLPPELEAVFTGRLGPAEEAALQSLGLSQRFYAGYVIAFDVMLALAGLVIGLLIFWRRPDDYWLTLWVALFLVALGTNGISLEVPSLGMIWPQAQWLSAGAGLLGMTSNVHILFLSPDGRAVPRWTLKVAAGFTGGLLALVLYTLGQLERWGTLMRLAFLSMAVLIWLIVLGLGLWSQVYRYRHVSGPVQRQQTKWMVVGLGAAALGFAVNALSLVAISQQAGLARVLLNLARAPLVYGCMLLLPICLAFSMLRYRLWDVDLIIRKTLIYSTLTGVLALAVLTLIVALESLLRTFTGHGQNQLVTVISTLAIAAVSGALRVWVQNFIDRRFYRRRYDAAHTLAAFALSARDDVDLDDLTGRLVAVVNETLQPASVGLWLARASGALNVRIYGVGGVSTDAFGPTDQRISGSYGGSGRSSVDPLPHPLTPLTPSTPSRPHLSAGTQSTPPPGGSSQ